MKNLLVKVFTAYDKEVLEMEMNRFLISIPESFLRDLGYCHSIKNGKDFFSSMIVYEKRHNLKKEETNG